MFGKIIRSTTAKLNDVNDAVAGASVASGTGLSSYAGQYGLMAEIGPDTIKYDPAVGVLFGGLYAYVKVFAGTAIAPKRGGIAFWLVPGGTNPAEDTYTVSGDPQPAAATPTLVAGVFLNSITPGNSGFIQVGGRASVLFDSALTAAAAGDWVTAKVTAATTTNGYPADVGAVAGPVTISAKIGTAEGLPVVSTISVVQMDLLYKRV